jgi:hypothetical protein
MEIQRQDDGWFVKIFGVSVVVEKVKRGGRYYLEIQAWSSPHGKTLKDVGQIKFWRIPTI